MTTTLQLGPAIPFSFGDDAVEAFTTADCGYLAIAINAASGLPMVTISDDEPDSWYHAGVRLPDGRILDIEGIWDPQDWMAHWDHVMGGGGEDMQITEWDLPLFGADMFERYFVNYDPAEWAEQVLLAYWDTIR
jgi:hypothetical protein